MKDEKISEYFTMAEACVSTTADEAGIDNRPDDVDTMLAILGTAAHMDVIREYLGVPVTATSWHRNAKVNKLVGGVPGSQHNKGEAVDFLAKGMTPAEVCLKLKPKMAEFQIDQLILEPGWVHVSFITHPQSQRTSPRNQFLIDKRVRKVDIPKGLL